MTKLEKNGNIIEIESTNEWLISRYTGRGYTIVE